MARRRVGRRAGSRPTQQQHPTGRRRVKPVGETVNGRLPSSWDGSLGTAGPYGTGSVRYRDSRGRTTFTTTTLNGVTRFYDSSDHLTATVIGSRRR
jgi:hypothetical protein